MTNTVKTRFAPSPTGLIHFGNVRTALFNALFARKHENGCFLLRIEDTDQERSQHDYTCRMQTDLRWLGLDWQEGAGYHQAPAEYHQSQRTDIYEQYLNILIEKGLAYPCFCTATELEISRKIQAQSGKPPRYSGKCTHLKPEEAQAKKDAGLNYTLRFRMPKGEVIQFEDLVKGVQKYNTDDIGDFIIRRSDGTYAFFFVNAIDDALMGVTHVLRGEDHLTNTPRQMAILQALDLHIPTYAHISLIVDQKGSPLSKRNGSLSVEELREKGYLPIAINNYLARLGHYYSDNNLLTLDELANQFDRSHLGTASAKYDHAQLEHWQTLAIQQLSIADLMTWLNTYVPEFSQIPVEKQEKIALAIRPNILYPQDAKLWIDILSASFCINEDHKAKINSFVDAEFFNAGIKILEDNSNINYKEFCNVLKQSTGKAGKSLFMPLRLSLTGQEHGPELASIFDVLGKEELIRRFANAR